MASKTFSNIGESTFELFRFFGSHAMQSLALNSIPWAVLVGILSGSVAFPSQRTLRIDWRGVLPSYLNTRLKFAILTGLCIAGLAVFVDPGTTGGGTSVIDDILLKGEEATWSLIAVRFFGTIISRLSGVAGGFLAPSLALGAAIGSKLAFVTSYSNPNLLVLVGMAAFLSANLRAPFTA